MFDLLGEVRFALFLRFLEETQGETTNDAETVAALAEAFYQHLCGPGRATNCCFAPAGRYCPEGERLREAYYEAVQMTSSRKLGKGTAKK
jgi:hypothetical protein